MTKLEIAEIINLLREIRDRLPVQTVKASRTLCETCNGSGVVGILGTTWASGVCGRCGGCGYVNS